MCYFQATSRTLSAFRKKYTMRKCIQRGHFSPLFSQVVGFLPTRFAEFNNLSRKGYGSVLKKDINFG
jgi:hypothetical protein